MMFLLQGAGRGSAKFLHALTSAATIWRRALSGMTVSLCRRRREEAGGGCSFRKGRDVVAPDFSTLSRAQL